MPLVIHSLSTGSCLTFFLDATLRGVEAACVMLFFRESLSSCATQINTPFPNYPWPLFQSKLWCSSFEKEVKGNSEMAYLLTLVIKMQNSWAKSCSLLVNSWVL